MPFIEISRPACFTHQLEKLIKKYKKSEKSIIKQIDSILNNPFQGNRIPGFGNAHMRKVRIPLKEYGIGRSGGIRIIYIVVEDNNKMLMVAIYTERDYKTENSVQSMIRQNLKSIDSSLL
ncbi:MAG: type II toxin-antitoxin system RelE/ParE family toxin [Candidatus Scalinduaceae bacterium]